MPDQRFHPDLWKRLSKMLNIFLIKKNFDIMPQLLFIDSREGEHLCNRFQVNNLNKTILTLRQDLINVFSID